MNYNNYLQRGFLFIIFLFTSAVGSLSIAQIVLNQVGFYPDGPKQAIVMNATLNKDFKLVDDVTGEVVFKEKLSEPMNSNNSSHITRIADFSDFKKPGKYRIEAGLYETKTFSIRENVQKEVGKAVLKGFYYQRVSVPLEEKYAGKWARPAGHPDDVVYVHSSAASKKRPEGTIISAAHGWYDAGDYNKYIVNSGITMGTLLSAYEDYPEYFQQLEINIPESGNGAPDILDEIYYNLRWMLDMQDPNDGGVYHKLTNASFDGLDAKPGQTKAPRYVVQKGTAAALDFAAVMAQASRVYKHFPEVFPGLAEKCLKAAQKAWNWAEKNPNLAYNQDEMNKTHKPEISTGAYADRNFVDEWFWAASELYITTNNKKYKKIIDANKRETANIPAWGNVYMLGVYSLLRDDKQEYKDFFVPGLLKLADELTGSVETNAFQVVMGKDRRDWMWGSSSQAANQSILLLNAYQLTKDKKYLHAAYTNTDYLLGKNATGYCFVTGFGYRPVMNPHHRLSVSDGIKDPIPGLLSGGPNATAHRSDEAYYEFTEPETTFADDDASFAGNEIAINWNAPAVYLFNAIEANRTFLFNASQTHNDNIIQITKIP